MQVEQLMNTGDAELTSMQKYINFLPTIAFSANTQASWEAVAVSFTAGLLNGGPVCTAYATAPSLLQALSCTDFPRLWYHSLLARQPCSRRVDG